MSDLLNSKEAAEYLNLPVRYVRYLSRTGQLAYININRHLRYYRKEHLDDYLENRTVPAQRQKQFHDTGEE